MSYHASFSVGGEAFELTSATLRRLRAIAMAVGAWALVFDGCNLIGEFDKRGNWHDLRPIEPCCEHVEFWQLAEVR